jgi:hypothetical protein
MNTRFRKIVLSAIASGIGCVVAASAVAYWHSIQRNWCVQFTAVGGQEITYSRGCHNPKRYKQWAVTAKALIPSPDSVQASCYSNDLWQSE